MRTIIDFPQADNLEFVYQVFCELPVTGLNRYSFSEKYGLHDRQGAYYLHALCFIGLANKVDKNTYLTTDGRLIQQLSEPFRRKAFLLYIFENQFVCDTYFEIQGKEKAEQKEIVSILIEGRFGINEPATRERRARTLLSWYRWMQEQEFKIEERYNE